MNEIFLLSKSILNGINKNKIKIKKRMCYTAWQLFSVRINNHG